MRVPTYEQQQGLQQVYSQPVGADIGPNPFQIAGKVLGDVAVFKEREAEEAKRRLEKQQEQDDNLWALNSMATFRQSTMQDMEQRMESMPPGGTNFAGGVNDSYEERLTAFKEMAPTKRSKAIFEASARQYQSSVFGEAIKTESQEKNRYRVESTIDAAMLESNQISTAGDTIGAWDQIALTRFAAIDGMLLSPDMKQKTKTAVATHFSKAIVLADGRTNPQEAIRRIDEGVYSQLPGFNLYGDQLEQLRTGLVAKTNQRDQVLLAQIKDSHEHWKKSMVDGDWSAPPVPISSEQIALLTPSEQIQVKHEIGSHKIAVDTLKAAPMLSIPQMNERIASLKEKVTTGKVDRLEADMAIDMAEKVRDGMIKQRSGLEGSDTGAAADAAAKLMFKDEYLRANDQTAVWAMRAVVAGELGIPKHVTNLMTNNEAKALVAQIEAGGVEDTQKALDDLQQMLSSPKTGVVTKEGLTESQFYPMVMGQLIANGLNKDYLVAEFAKGTKYRQYITQGIKGNGITDIRAEDAERVKATKEAMNTSKELNSFLTTVGLAGGPAGAEYSASIKKVITNAAVLAGAAYPGQPAQIVKDIISDVVTNQVSINNTYYVPKTNPKTGQPIDALAVDRRLKNLADGWALPKGGKFIPDISASIPALRGTEAEANAINKATNYMWVTNENGSGVYLTIPLAGAIGLHQPIVNKENQRYEIMFSDLVAPVSNDYSQSISNTEVKGKIRRRNK
jgi:hypothetical protein